MPSLKETAALYKELLEAGKNMEVINVFYSDDIIQAENESIILKGKNEIIEAEQKSLAGVHSFKQVINTLVIDEEKQIIMGEMTIHFNSKKLGMKILKEAFVQQWANNKINYQKFYYKEFSDAD